MKPINSVFVLQLLVALWLNFPAVVNAAGARNSVNQRGGRAAEHMSGKGSSNNNAQWSADPDKGWVRADERHKAHEKKDSTGEANRQNGKAKSKGNPPIF
jgi:hypothetical protein